MLLQCTLMLTALAGPLAEEDAIDLALARRCFDETAALSEADGGALWGRPLHGPMLLVEARSRQVVANQRDSAGLLTERDGVWVGVLPESMHVANTACTWGELSWTMLMWPLPDDRYARARLLIHECFHRIQGELGLPASDTDNGHLDSRDGRIWMRMEWRALREALLHEGPQRIQAIEDALAFRAQRRAIFPAAVEAERTMELNEGLAEYTGLRLSGLPAGVLADRAAIALAQQEQQDTFLRNFAYASGPAYGVLLDQLLPHWRTGLSVKDDLGELLAKAAKIAVPAAENLAAEAQRRAGRYDDGRVIAPETRRDEQRQQRQAQFRARFVQGPTLELPAAANISYSYNPNEVEALPGVGAVYLSAKISDEWGALTVETGGALMLRQDGRVKAFRVSAPADAKARPLKGEGWTLDLADGWDLQPGAREGDWVVMPRAEVRGQGHSDQRPH